MASRSTGVPCFVAGRNFHWLSAPAWLANKFGFAAIASLLSSDAIAKAAGRAQLDGLLALWQPPSAD